VATPARAHATPPMMLAACPWPSVPAPLPSGACPLASWVPLYPPPPPSTAAAELYPPPPPCAVAPELFQDEVPQPPAASPAIAPATATVDVAGDLEQALLLPEAAGGAALTVESVPVERPPQPSGPLTCTTGASGDCSRVQWVIEERKLKGQDKQAVSPAFTLDLPELGPTPFRLTIYPRPVSESRGGAGFRRAKGQGRVELKCEAQLPPPGARGAKGGGVVFRIAVGRESKAQPWRGPVRHDFSEHSCCGLPRGQEDWDFQAAVDESRTFAVHLELTPFLGLGGGEERF